MCIGMAFFVSYVQGSLSFLDLLVSIKFGKLKDIILPNFICPLLFQDFSNMYAELVNLVPCLLNICPSLFQQCFLYLLNQILNILFAGCVPDQLWLCVCGHRPSVWNSLHYCGPRRKSRTYSIQYQQVNFIIPVVQ